MTKTNRKQLPASIGSYRIIKRGELTDAQRAILRVAGRERVVARICALIGDGRLAVSQVQAQYGALMAEVGDA